MVKGLTLEELTKQRNKALLEDTKIYCCKINCTYRYCKKHWNNRKINQTIIFKDFEYKLGICHKDIRKFEKRNKKCAKK